MFDDLEPCLLKARVGVKLFNGIKFADVKKILAKRKQKKYGFKETAVVVEQIDDDLYNVRLEYIY